MVCIIAILNFIFTLADIHPCGVKENDSEGERTQLAGVLLRRGVGSPLITLGRTTRVFVHVVQLRSPFKLFECFPMALNIS
ncbi:hypothetical protein EDD22DRAFT_570410 [Suillus occidentalis]|nr:hypothetical protein EDD22DRAFT_570410 [Suillus occidentalis]